MLKFHLPIFLMLKCEFDVDELIIALRSAKNTFTLPCLNISTTDQHDFVLYILSNLLENPSEKYINALIINTHDNFFLFTNMLKTLIKTHFLQLTDQKNIITIVNMFYTILDDKKIAEPASVNLLRYSSYYPVLQALETNDIFTMYFKGITGSIENTPHVYGRDFVFENVCDCLINNRQNNIFASNEYLHFPTPKQFLITKISSNLELNVIFYIEKVENYKHFYEAILFKKYITSLEIAKNVLRYLVAVYYTNNVERLIDIISRILEYYNNEILLIAVFYDILFYNKNEEVNHFLFYYLGKCMNNENIWIFLKKCIVAKEIEQNLQCWLSNFGGKSEHIAKKLGIDFIDISHIQRKIEKLDFDSYHKLVANMKLINVPFIPYSHYQKVISSSYTWDGYMQVFLWKILAFQKILFRFEVDHYNFETLEAKEGYEILINLK